MDAYGAYDGALQMYVETDHLIDYDALSFVRWLVETGRLVDDTEPDQEN